MSSLCRQFYFLHIPKTAGTSLRTVIEAQFSPSRINHEYNSLAQIVRIPPDEFAQYHLIRGHFPYSLVEKFRVFPHILTMLRHPVERTISHLLHVKRDPSFWLHQYVPLASAPLEEILRYDATKKFVCNHQLRLVGLDFDLQHVQEPKMFYAPDCADEELLNIACRRLTMCDFVGIAERFADSIELLCQRFCWPLVTSLPHLNVRERSSQSQEEEISPEVVQRILELNVLEIKFYEFAYRLFEDRLTRMRTVAKN
ncbi:MAG: sulfotransferase family 2 domain-containing protein [Candidatus Binatia bacterium]